MINNIFSSLGNVITTFFNWLVNINEQVPVLDIALGFFLVCTLSRFFIYPMLKGGINLGSDEAQDMEKWAQKKQDREIYYQNYTNYGAEWANYVQQKRESNR